MLSAEPGLHRFVWDIRHPRPRGVSFSYPISAIPGQTVPEPLGPFVVPGTYTIRLTVDGTVLTQPLRVRMDPRVRTPVAGVRSQSQLALQLLEGVNRAADGLSRARTMIQSAREAGDSARVTLLSTLSGPGGGGGGPPTFARLSSNLVQLMQVVDDTDRPPTSQVRTAATELLRQLTELERRLSVATR